MRFDYQRWPALVPLLTRDGGTTAQRPVVYRMPVEAERPRVQYCSYAAKDRWASGALVGQASQC